MVDDPVGNYPRPQQRRAWWLSLEGPWDFAREPRARWTDPSQVRWSGTIRVPFAPETKASGVGDTGFHEVCWYRRSFDPPALAPGERLILHFNAVDWAASVWANGCFLTSHEGGYTPFAADLTQFAHDRPIVLIVRAHDDPRDLAKPRGKQDWQLEPHSIWYPRTSGIWQTVWVERLPETSIDVVQWTPNLERWELGLEARIGGRERDDLRLQVLLTARDVTLAHDVYSVISCEVTRRIALSDPGIDDYRNELLWSPHSPTLIDARLELLDPQGNVIDAVDSYTALRAISIQAQTVLLNGRPYPLRMVLDQGYWPDTGLTPPDTAALRHDVELAKAMGFNGVRKHQKVEDERYLYWADRLGLLVWSEMPSAYRFTRASVERLGREWMEVLRRDYSHPCVIVWVPFNESWGVPNLPEIQEQRHFVQALYHLTQTIDPTRIVVGNDGWESGATDIIGIHDYDDSPERLMSRYRLNEDIPHLFQRERPGGRAIMLEGHPHAGQPIVLSEFGGIACSDGRQTWGYSFASNNEQFADRVTRLIETVRQLPSLAGFCYTQFADTYQEANGLLTADRTPKIPIERIAEAVRGLRRKRQEQAEPQSQAEQEKRVERGAMGSQHEPAAP